jgi:RNA polymerase sigma-70 factor (ECF subfamily)
MNNFPRFTSHTVLGSQEYDPPFGGSGSQEPEDNALVYRAQSGEMAAYDVLVLRHRNRIFAMIRNMTHNDADAWDLSQEVFIKAWHALPAFEAKAKFSTWLYRISHNVFYDWSRRRKHEHVAELNDEELQSVSIDASAIAIPHVGDSPDRSMEMSELKKKIEWALIKISPEHRQIVMLKDVQGLSYKEIAEVTGCTIGTVMSRLFYARQKLQALLKDEYKSR